MKTQIPEVNSVVQSEFFKALDEFDLTKLRSLLDSGFDVDTLSPEGHSGLQIALKDNNVDAAELLIERGANTQLPGLNGGSLLNDAAWSGRLTEQLLARGLPHNTVNNDGLEPIHQACQTGSERSLIALVKAGANIRTYCRSGRPPSHYATEGLDSTFIKFVVSLGASYDDRDADGGNLFQALAKNPPYGILAGDLDEFVGYLQDEGLDINAPDKQLRICLHFSGQRGSTNVTESLLRAGADPFAKDKSGATPSSMATERNLRVIERHISRDVVTRLDPSTRLSSRPA